MNVLNSVVLFDGMFHLFGFPDFIKNNGPDWILARGLFDTLGFPIWSHRVIGVYLIFSSLYAFFVTNVYTKFYLMLIVPIVIVIIISAIIVKLRNTSKLYNK